MTAVDNSLVNKQECLHYHHVSIIHDHRNEQVTTTAENCRTYEHKIKKSLLVVFMTFYFTML